jgi:hypothetical protein
MGGLLWFALAGCAGRAPKLNREWLPRELHLQVAENYRQLQTFRGEANLAVESPQMQFSARARILALKPDSLFIIVEAGFVSMPVFSLWIANILPALRRCKMFITMARRNKCKH